jgi:hypothetical protein
MEKRMSTEQIKKDIDKLQKELSKREKLQKQFPDLKEHVNRWKTKRLQAASANAIATDIELVHGCGCCNDAPLYANPYLLVDGEKIYSDPIQICVGERNPNSYSRDTWDEDWEETLKKHNISQQAIDSIRSTAERDLRWESRYWDLDNDEKEEE